MPTSTKQYGRAVAWGLVDGAFTWSGSASGAWATTARATDQTVGFDAQLDDSAKDPTTGATLGVVMCDFTKEITLKVFPSATSLAAAATSAEVIPQPGDIFIVAAGDALTVDAAGYLVIKSSRMRKVGGKAEFDVTLKKWEFTMALAT